MNETAVSIAACAIVRPMSTDDGIAPNITVGGITSRASVDCVIPVIAFKRVIAGRPVDEVTSTGAVDGAITGAPIDYLAVVTSSRDGVAWSSIDVRRIRYFLAPRGQRVEMVVV